MPTGYGKDPVAGAFAALSTAHPVTVVVRFVVPTVTGTRTRGSVAMFAGSAK